MLTNEASAGSAATLRNELLLLCDPATETTLDAARVDQHLVAFTFGEKIRPEHLAAWNEYKRIVASILSTGARRPLKRILIASPQHQDGRTTVTLNLAAALARTGRRVVVLDADFCRPSLQRVLGVSVEIGLSEAVERRLSPGEAIVRILPAGFDVIPSRERVDDALSVLASAGFEQLLQLLMLSHDFILLDSPPLVTSANANLLARVVDGIVLVIRPGSTSPGELVAALSGFDKDDIAGVVLNRVHTT